MRLALLEIPARFGAFDEVMNEVRALARPAAADVLLLPECALTGYVDARGSTDLAPFAEDAGGRTCAALRDLAVEVGAVVAGPWIEREGARCFNAFVAFDPRGQRIVHYRKRHPWLPERWASPGDVPLPRFEVAGVRLTLAICYDVHFLLREARSVLEESDALLFPSAWVDSGPDDLRGPIFERLRSRTGVAIANANWGPGVPRLRGQGRTRFVDGEGSVVEIEGPGGQPARMDVDVRKRGT